MAPFLRAAATLALSAAAAAAAAPGGFDLQLLPPDIAARRGAACLDGTRPGVYLMRGSDANKWRVHFHGGGWCSSIEDCESRAGGQYGSSATWPTSVYDLCDSPTQCTAVFGLLSNYSDNPMGTWNAVLVPYCESCRAALRARAARARSRASFSVADPLARTRASSFSRHRARTQATAPAGPRTAPRRWARCTFAAAPTSTPSSTSWTPSAPSRRRRRTWSLRAPRPAASPCTRTPPTSARACPRARRSWPRPTPDSF